MIETHFAMGTTIVLPCKCTPAPLLPAPFTVVSAVASAVAWVGGEVRRPWVPCHRPVWVLRNRVLEPLEYCRAVPRGVLACEGVVEGDGPFFHVDDDQSPVYGVQVLAWEYDMLHRQPVGVVAVQASAEVRASIDALWITLPVAGSCVRVAVSDRRRARPVPDALERVRHHDVCGCRPRRRPRLARRRSSGARDAVPPP